MIKDYYYLTKPGIIYGNLLTTVAGFLLASRFPIRLSLFLGTVVGSSLIMASACVVNNCLDIEIDKKMERTKIRALAIGKISKLAAITFALILFFLGCLVLILFVNLLVLLIGLYAFFAYVVVYGYAKRRSVYGTLVGSLSGAAPIVGGYCAVTGTINLSALLLYLVMITWQMPHFYAIAIRRSKDYKNAGLPVWPNIKGVESAKKQIVFFIVLFIDANLMLSLFGPTKVIYALILTTLGLYWLRLALKKQKDNLVWARQLFLYSLVVVLIMSVSLSFGAILA